MPHAGAVRAGTAAVSADALVVFTPSGKRGRFALGTPLLAAARALGVDVDSVCGGRGLCGRCQVLVMEGEFAKHGVRSSATHLSAFSAVEERYGARRQPLRAQRWDSVLLCCSSSPSLYRYENSCCEIKTCRGRGAYYHQCLRRRT